MLPNVIQIKFKTKNLTVDCNSHLKPFKSKKEDVLPVIIQMVIDFTQN